MSDQVAKTLEILKRPFDAGSQITNCIPHAGLLLNRRPDDCRFCAADIKNHLALAVTVNAFLNEVKEESIAALEDNANYRVLRRIPFMPKMAEDTPDDRATWRKLVVLDTETTGLDTKTAKVIELGLAEVFYAIVNGRAVLREFGRCESWFQDPGEPLSEETKRVTEISDEDVRGKSIPMDIVETYIADRASIVAHNAAYDRPIVEREMPTFKERNWACSVAEIDWKGEFGSPSNALKVIAWNAGLFFDAHRAANDVAALSYLLGTTSLKGETALSTLVASASTPWVRLSAVGADFDKKDKLKARGYTRNPDRKFWFIDMKTPAAADAEQAWLKLEVLYGREPSVKIIKAIDRYSERV